MGSSLPRCVKLAEQAVIEMLHLLIINTYQKLSISRSYFWATHASTFFSDSPLGRENAMDVSPI